MTYFQSDGAFGCVPPEYYAYRASKALGGGGVKPWEWAERDDWWMEWVLLIEGCELEVQSIRQKQAARKQKKR